jgi:hypothetical protein
LLAAAGFEGLSRVRLATIRFGRLAGAFVILVLALSALANLQTTSEGNSLPAALGIDSADEYVTRKLGAYGPAMEAVRSLPEGSLTLALWEPRGLYCRPRCQADVWLDQWYVDRQLLGEVEQIRREWIRRGYTHVLLHRAGMEFVMREDARFTPDDWDALSSLLSVLEEVSTFGDGYDLYRLTP